MDKQVKVSILRSTMILIFIVILMNGLIKSMSPPKPIFEPGDCVQFQDPTRESWESEFKIDRILAVGNYKYRIGRSSIDFSDQKFYKKVECPKE